MEIINQYSIVWSGVILLGLGAFFLIRRGVKAKNGLFLLLLAAFLVVGWIVIRPDQASADDMAQFEAELGAGRSVLLELQSPF
jgi:hypothetical protein